MVDTLPRSGSVSDRPPLAPVRAANLALFVIFCAAIKTSFHVGNIDSPPARPARRGPEQDPPRIAVV